jgi:hypothetical protein
MNQAPAMPSGDRPQRAASTSPRRHGRGVEEAVAGNVVRSEVDGEVAHRGVVELRVEQPPRIAVAVLRDPVVFEKAPIEVAGKADAKPGRDAVRAQDRHGEARERNAGAEAAIRRRTRHVERPVVPRGEPIEQLGHRAHRAVARGRLRHGDPAHGSEERVQEQAGHLAHDVCGLRGQRLQVTCPATRIRPAAVRAVEVDGVRHRVSSSWRVAGSVMR